MDGDTCQGTGNSQSTDGPAESGSASGVAEGETSHPTLAAARELQSKISLGENGGKKRRKYNVEKYLSHPQFCRLGSTTNVDKKAFDENFERIFGSKPPPVEYGERHGYVVKPYTGKHEAVLLGGDGPTKDERETLRKKRIERLRKAKQ